MSESTLDKVAAKRWIKDQQVAQARIENERFHFLLNLTVEDALRSYLGLIDLQAQSRKAQEGGSSASPLLVAMRRALRQYSIALKE